MQVTAALLVWPVHLAIKVDGSGLIDHDRNAVFQASSLTTQGTRASSPSAMPCGVIAAAAWPRLPTIGDRAAGLWYIVPPPRLRLGKHASLLGNRAEDRRLAHTG